MSLKGRLDRLERRQPAQEANRLPPHFWEIIAGVADPEILDADEQEQFRRFIEEGGEAEHARCMENHPAGKCYREELARLGLPQPPTLAGIDIIEECIRLAGIPAPDPGTNGDLSNGLNGQPRDGGPGHGRGVSDV
jgi:hypothetical protein